MSANKVLVINVVNHHRSTDTNSFGGLSAAVAPEWGAAEVWARLSPM
jgi:hypothetical protein